MIVNYQSCLFSPIVARYQIMQNILRNKAKVIKSLLITVCLSAKPLVAAPRVLYFILAQTPYVSFTSNTCSSSSQFPFRLSSQTPLVDGGNIQVPPSASVTLDLKHVSPRKPSCHQRTRQRPYGVAASLSLARKGFREIVKWLIMSSTALQSGSHILPLQKVTIDALPSSPSSRYSTVSAPPCFDQSSLDDDHPLPREACDDR